MAAAHPDFQEDINSLSSELSLNEHVAKWLVLQALAQLKESPSSEHTTLSLARVMFYEERTRTLQAIFRLVDLRGELQGEGQDIFIKQTNKCMLVRALLQSQRCMVCGGVRLCLVIVSYVPLRLCMHAVVIINVRDFVQSGPNSLALSLMNGIRALSTDMLHSADATTPKRVIRRRYALFDRQLV